MWVELRLQGQPAHGSRPWDGRNALALLREGLAAMERRFPTPDEAAWVTTVVPTVVQGGEAGNRLPEAITMDARHPPRAPGQPRGHRRWAAGMLPRRPDRDAAGRPAADDRPRGRWRAAPGRLRQRRHPASRRASTASTTPPTRASIATLASRRSASARSAPACTPTRMGRHRQPWPALRPAAAVC